MANRLSVIHDGSMPRQWPTNPGVPEAACEDEEVKNQVNCCVSNVQYDAGSKGRHGMPGADKEQESEDPMIRFTESYSCWHRLKRSVAWSFRCRDWLRAKTRSKERPPLVNADPLDPLDQQAAEISSEIAIVKSVQHKHFKGGVEALKSRKPVEKKRPIYILEPFLGEEGILRVPLPEKAQHPIFLPKNHHVSRFVARRALEFQSRHCGKEYVLSLIRQKFWIVGARPLVKGVLRECIPCKRLKGRPGVQEMADLLSEGVTPDNPPFSYLGVDSFGHLVVKRDRSQLKGYSCLFTCLTMRAIHIEKLDSLEVYSFINAFVRFCARRGVPERVRPDIGTNFVGGEKELREAMRSWNDDSNAKAHFLQKEIKWEFNLPAASHMGGIWERQIRTVRKVLNVILREQIVDDERLCTLFRAVESIVNGRPLTVLSDDPNDETLLTPIHLLPLRGRPHLLPGRFGQRDISMEGVGDMFSSSLTSFGSAGFVSICPLSVASKVVTAEEKFTEWRCGLGHG